MTEPDIEENVTTISLIEASTVEEQTEDNKGIFVEKDITTTMSSMTDEESFWNPTLQSTEATDNTTGEMIDGSSGLSASARAGIIAGLVLLFWLILGPIVCITWHARDSLKQRSRGYFQNGTWFSNKSSPSSNLCSAGCSSDNERTRMQEMVVKVKKNGLKT